MNEQNETPRANRIHIGLFGKTNAGKSSIINAVCGQDVALVSEIEGTTTDPVYKSMELLPLGPVVWIDTAGLDDRTPLSHARREKTKSIMHKTDLALVVVRATDADLTLERKWIDELGDTPVLLVYNRFDAEAVTAPALPGIPSVTVNASTGEGIGLLKEKIARGVQQESVPNLTEGLVRRGDLVVLVMPQDMQAPKGRLILPQVQVTRDLLDHGCKVVSVRMEEFGEVLGELKHPPALVITDSQVFAAVNELLPKTVPLTSFSILMAKVKGKIDVLADGARCIEKLQAGDRVLIAEACTHHALKGDIAREKLPALLERHAGGALSFEHANGQGFPANLSDYKLVICCGGCMINRKNMLHRMARAQEAGVPVTNFGMAFAFLNGILSRVCW